MYWEKIEMGERRYVRGRAEGKNERAVGSSEGPCTAKNQNVSIFGFIWNIKGVTSIDQLH